MRAIFLAAILGGMSTVAAAQQPPAPKKAVQVGAPGNKSSKPDASKKDDFDMAKLMAMFDKIFPPQPEPAPEGLALARSTAMGVLPDGTYAAMFNDMMSGVVDRVLSMSPAELGDKKPNEAGANMTLREEIAKGDPHFDERMRIVRRVISEELVKIAALVEPRLRDGLARSIARRFDEQQLRDINAFLATDTGRAFGSQSMRLWIDPDVMRSMFQTFPDLFAAMPGAMKRLEAETAHLPKPPKKAKEKVEDEGEVSAGDEVVEEVPGT